MKYMYNMQAVQSSSAPSLFSILIISLFVWTCPISGAISLSHLSRGNIPVGHPVHVSRELTHFSLPRSVVYLSGCNYAGTATIFDRLGVLFLITNKHVIQLNQKYQHNTKVPPGRKCKFFHLNGDASTIQFVHKSMKMYVTVFPNVTQDDWSLVRHPIRVKLSQTRVVCHNFLDLCVIKLSDRISSNFSLFISTFNESHIAHPNEIEFIEDIFMIGYPLPGLDKTTYFPLIRKGITSSAYRLPYRGYDIGLADIGAFSGSSGSPILISKRIRWTRDGQGLPNYIRLLGIHFGAPYNFENIVVGPNGNTTNENYQVNLPPHFGTYVKGFLILKLVDTLAIIK